MNWGGFAGGFAQGFNNGVAMGKTIGDVMKQKKIEDVRAQGIAEAQAARAAAVDGAIQEGGSSNPAATMGVTGQPAATQEPAAKPQALPMAEDPMTADQKPAEKPIKPEDEDRPLTRRRVLAEQPDIAPATQKPSAAPAAPAQSGLPFMVGGKGYATREEARAAAEKATPDVMHFMSKTLVPRMQQAYIEQGDIEKADAWGKWAEDKENQQNMRDWGSAYKASIVKDYRTVKKHLANIHKRYDDGLDLVDDGDDEVKDTSGNVIGFKIKMKRKDTGEVTEKVVNPTELVNYGLMALSPQSLFETQWKRQQAADQAVAEEKAQMRREQRGLQIDNYKAERDNIYAKGLKKVDNQYQTERDVRQQQDRIEMKTIENQLDAANTSAKVRREVMAKAQILREAGKSEEFINEALPGMLGIGEYKKPTSPEEARRLFHSDRMKSDLTYPAKSPEEQKMLVDQDMALVYGSAKPGTTPRTAAPSTPSSPPVWRP